MHTYLQAYVEWREVHTQWVDDIRRHTWIQSHSWVVLSFATQAERRDRERKGDGVE